MKGRTVKIFLVDGTPSGVVTAEIMNWTGRITVAPRSQLPDLAKRTEVKKTGVYILTGENPINPIQTQVYVGESDNVWKRLTQHAQDTKKDFWQRTVIIISKDENLTKAHVRYLESRLIQTISQANRVNLSNGTAPDIPSLPEPDIADMEYFLGQILILLPVLGFSFASPLPTITRRAEVIQGDIQPEPSSTVFQMTYAGVQAFAQEVNNEFVVLKESTARKKEVNSLTDPYIQMRKQLYADGKLADGIDKDYWVFTQDVPFTSPSAAAAVIGGSPLNGRVNWKEKDTQKTYAEWQEEQIEMVTEETDADDVN
ncbi:MAG: GIY-YIG nuclease family protein [Anaerolineae bacterium]|nr:GIY-YIG nuclease family protein [Anaerolineae bacterium]